MVVRPEVAPFIVAFDLASVDHLEVNSKDGQF